MRAHPVRSVLVLTALVAGSLGAATLGPPAGFGPPPAGAAREVVPGSNGPLVFTSDRDGDNEIFLMGNDGTSPVQLTFNDDDDRMARWSPDAGTVAFSSDRDGGDDVFVMNIDGSGQVNLTNSPTSQDLDPVWSPDGTRLAFTTNRTGNYEVFTMAADGSDPVNVTGDPANDYSADWSPDGSKLAFSTDRDGNYEVYKVNPDGTNPRRLTTDSHRDVQPAWSPDGTTIAFASDRLGSFSFATDVFTMGRDGGSQTRVSGVPNKIDEWPAWSPNGNKIVFQSDRDGTSELYKMSPDGSSVTRLTTNTALDAYADWQTVPKSRADLLIRRDDQSSYGGNNVYNLTGAGQTRSEAVRRGGRAVFYVRVTNDGSVTDTYRVRARNSSVGWVTVKYVVDGTDRTPAVAGTGVVTDTILPQYLMPDAGVTVKVVVTMSATAPPSAGAEIEITGTSQNDRDRKDTVVVRISRA